MNAKASGPPRQRKRPAASPIGFGLLGVCLALYATIPGTFSDDFDNLFFPVFWALFVTSGYLACAVFLLFIPIRTNQVFRKALSFVPIGFGLGYALLLINGFDATGDWMRFALFQIGLRDEQEIKIGEPPEWKTYVWRSWGIAGLHNFSYLVHDPLNRIHATTNQPKLLGLDCTFLDRRLISSWHLLTTFECVLSPVITGQPVTNGFQGLRP